MSRDASTLDALLDNPRVWRGRQQPQATPGLPSGYPELDRHLPGGGWPPDALTEILTAHYGIGELRLLMPALLLVVYEAFGRTQEDQIYDTLARVTDGDALEYLYLERVGAMAGGGLEEADQTIHEIALLESRVDRDGPVLSIDASWLVIGTVGHAEHLHVRGNTYSAQLTVEPVDDAWKITEFELLDVNRDSAGETFPAPEAD